MTNPILPADKTLLLVDDDKPFLTRLARAMEIRGFEVLMAESVAEGVAQIERGEHVDMDDLIAELQDADRTHKAA